MKLIMTVALILLTFSPLANAATQPGLERGTLAPDFEALNYENKTVKLSDLYQQGPVVLVFYRGGWCPFCNTQLRELQAHLKEIKKYNATLIALSVDKPLKGAETVKNLDLTFDIISDNQIEILKKYRLINLLSENQVKAYKDKNGIDVEEYSGHFDHTVAIPATYIIDQSGTIMFAYANQDYKVRATPAQILEALAKMKDDGGDGKKAAALPEVLTDVESLEAMNDGDDETTMEAVPESMTDAESLELKDDGRNEPAMEALPEIMTDKDSLESIINGDEMIEGEVLKDDGDTAAVDNAASSLLDAGILFTPINHASMVIEAEPLTIYVDPVGEMAAYENFKQPDIILITHSHEDHLDPQLISQLKNDATIVIGPKEIIDTLGFGEILNNEERGVFKAITIEALASYNLTEDRLKFHEKGRGNGYVLNLNNKRIYISGDTEDIPEMRALKDIDYAFICMNDPYTMTVEQAVSAVRAFSPKVVIPYHYRGTDGKSDVNLFKDLVSKDNAIDVKLLKWY